MTEHLDLEKSFTNIDLLIASFNNKEKIPSDAINKVINEIDEIRKILSQCETILDRTDHTSIPTVLTKRQLEYIEKTLQLNTDQPLSQFFSIIGELRNEIQRVQSQKNSVKQNGQDSIISGRRW